MSVSEFEQSQAQENNPAPVNTGPGGTATVPNSVGALVCGILTIVMCWCYLIPPAALGIIAIVLANQGEKLYKLNPSLYSIASYKNLRAGKICAIIGLSLVGVYVVCIIIYFLIVGSVAFGLLNAFGK